MFFNDFDTLFKREIQDKNYSVLYNKWIKCINPQNLEKIHKRNIKKIFHTNEYQTFIRFEFQVLKQWIKFNQNYSELYIDKLEKIIDKLNLKYLLSAQELEYITHVHYIVFIKYKHLKNIIVDFNLTDKKENIFFKYDEINFYSNEKEMISNGEIFFTTKQIIIRDKINTFSIELDKIIDFKLSNNNLIVWTKNDTFTINTYDPYVLYVSFERILSYLKLVK